MTDSQHQTSDWSLLVAQAVKILQERWWKIETEKPYVDPNTGVVRHIDIFAINKIEIPTSSRSLLRKPFSFEIRLFIECKYIKEEVILHSRLSDDERSMRAFKELWIYSDIYDEKKWVKSNPKHPYLSTQRVIWSTSDNGPRWFGKSAVIQACQGILSESIRSSNNYSITYPIIIGSHSERIKIRLEDGTECEYSYPQYFDHAYMHPRKNIEWIFLPNLVPINYLEFFLMEKALELMSIKEDITQFEFNRQVYFNEEHDYQPLY